MLEADGHARKHAAALVGDGAGNGGGGFLGDSGRERDRANRTRQQHRVKHQRRIRILRTARLSHVYIAVTLSCTVASGTLVAANDLHWRDRRRRMLPLRAIINASVALGIHPNVLTLIGVLINVVAAWCLAIDRFVAGRRDHDRRQHLRLHRRQGRAHHRQAVGSSARSGTRRSIAFPIWRCSPGLIWLYAELGRNGYVLVATLALIFSIMTSYARARAESLIEKCKVGFMERPERIVLFMIGAFTNRMAGVLWVLLVLSIITVSNRIHYTYLVLNNKPMPARRVRAVLLLARRTRDAALRHLGDRDPGVRVAGAAGLDERSDGHRDGSAGVLA